MATWTECLPSGYGRRRLVKQLLQAVFRADGRRTADRGVATSCPTLEPVERPEREFGRLGAQTEYRFAAPADAVRKLGQQSEVIRIARDFAAVTGEPLDQRDHVGIAQFNKHVGLFERAPKFSLRKPDGTGITLQCVAHEPVHADVGGRAIAFMQAEDDFGPVILKQGYETIDVPVPALPVRLASRDGDGPEIVECGIEECEAEPGAGMTQLVPACATAADIAAERRRDVKHLKARFPLQP
jgi:hypothetical protein